MSSRTGVTGSSGVLGRRIVEVLHSRGTAVDSFRGDVRDRPSVDKWVSSGDFSTVIHCAALVPVDIVQSDPARAIAVNVGGTANVAEAARRKGIRVLYVSSSHVYGAQAAPLKESDACLPTSKYGLTKLQGEDWCRTILEDFLIARVFSYFDPDQPAAFVISNLRNQIASAPSGGEILLRGSSSVRDFSSGSWVAQAIAHLAQSEHRGTFNVGSGVASSIGEIAKMLAVKLHRPDIRFTTEASPLGDYLVANTAKLKAAWPSRPPHDLGSELQALCVKD